MVINDHLQNAKKQKSSLEIINFKTFLPQYDKQQVFDLLILIKKKKNISTVFIVKSTKYIINKS